MTTNGDRQRTDSLPCAAQHLPAAQAAATPPTIGGRDGLRRIGRERLRGMGFVRIRTGVKQAGDTLCELYGVAEWLGPTDYGTALRLAEMYIKHRRLAEHLERQGIMTQAGEPKKALAEFRMLGDSLLRHEERLGLPAAARFALRVDAFRGDTFAGQMQGAREARREA